MSKLWKSLLDFGANPSSHQTKPTKLETTADRHSSVSSALVPDDHAPSNCEEYVPNIKSEESSENLVKLQQNLIAQLQLKITDMAKDAGEKEKTITKLESGLAECTHNWEGQLNQLLWLNSVVQKKDVELYDKDLTISALEGTVSDQASTINNLCIDYEDMQAKFISIYDHCKNLARDRQKKMDYIAILHSSEEKAKEITVQQQNLTKSLLALVEKERKTKFIEGSHTLYFSVTETTPAIRNEMANSKTSIRREDITKLARLVDSLAHKYSPDKNRYSQSNTTNDSEQVCATNPDHLPPAVPKEMFSIWLHSHEVDHTVE